MSWPVWEAVVALGLFVAPVGGYLLWLACARRPTEPTSSAGRLPSIDVIVAVYNERRLLPRKLRNLAALSYPADRVRFLIVDGSSTDGSADIVRRRAATDARFVLTMHNRPDKTEQLNRALALATAPWVLVTDADAWLPRLALQALLAAAVRDAGVGAVGCPVIPRGAHPAEQLHWRLLNWLHARESWRGTSPIAVAPCYGFRRDLVPEFPANVINDDVYVSWRVATTGHRVSVTGPMAFELRSARTFGQILQQKKRRGLGYLREIFRFLPTVGRMSARMRVTFGVRAAVFAGGPLVAAAVVATSVAWISIETLLILVPACAAGAASLLAWRPSRRVLLASLQVPLVMTAASLVLFTYPFVKQTAQLPRLPDFDPPSK